MQHMVEAEIKCVFDTPLIVERFACSQAIPVIRRGGTEMNCQLASCQAQCQRVLDQIKPVALQALGTEDDLLTMPRSAILKIHHGTLIGLNLLVNKIEEPIEDIHQLIESSLQQYPSDIPMESIVSNIINFKTRTRRSKNSSKM